MKVLCKCITALGLLSLFSASVHAGEHNRSPLEDRHPLKLDMEEKQLLVEQAVPDSGEPVTAKIRPGEGLWDCSSKLWILLDIENKGTTPVFVRGETSSKNVSSWAKNKGGVLVPPHEMNTLPILIVRGEVDERTAELEGLFNRMRGYPGGHQQTGWKIADASAVNAVKLEFFTDGSAVKCFLKNLRAAGDFELPSNQELTTRYRPATDAYGQNRNQEWKFKIRTDADFADRLASEEAWLDKFQTLEKRSTFGGWTGGFRAKGNGHFQTLEQDGKWWLIDPEGWPFWSVGATGFNHNLGKTVTPGAGKWNPRRSNLIKKFGEDWEINSAVFTHRRLKAWGMNTLGNWSTPAFYLMKKTPYTVACHFKRPSIHEPDSKAHSSLPDVFHPEYRAMTFAAVARFKQEASDPWCIGYFIDNELPFSKAATPAQKVLLSDNRCESRQEFIRRLKTKYESIEKLNTAWKSDFSGWEVLAPVTGNWSEKRGADMLEFSEAWYHRYFETCRAAMREHAPKKLYLGSRINHTGNHSALSICAEYADVVSINFYDYTPDRFKAPDGFNAPIMIGEFHFGTLNERGMWGSGLCSGMDIQHASDLFSNYVTEALKNPLLVGAHWFKFSDQPLTGRSDGENYRIGFVDVTDTPYPEMVKACRSVAETMYTLRVESDF
ncbi:beta-galactosidase [Pontiellaceae bacterium B12227]|nr:beta-galactosidase [Pontiellaceae bacterium B12227]